MFKRLATNPIDTWVGAGVLVETTGKRKDRAFAYRSYLGRLPEETEV